MAALPASLLLPGNSSSRLYLICHFLRIKRAWRNIRESFSVVNISQGAPAGA
jgi:hypothetical protein